MSVWGQQRALDRLTDRLTAIADDVSDLKRDSRKLDLEFTELYDKVRHQMSRMAKRDAVAAKVNGGDPPEDEPVDNLDPISRSIMMRRGMVRSGQ